MKRVLMGVWLCFAIVAIYWPVYSFDFVNFDDDVYLVDNGRVHDGLTASNVRWAFTTGHHSNWHPVTWLSYLLDIDLFGLNPGAMHVVNVVLHGLCTLLLFGLMVRVTSAEVPSLLVALLFAVHPLHVESVAWISERKDVLSTTLLLLTMHAYVSYARSSSVRFYIGAAVFFALGLMAKPMLVTLPVLLLLFDYWPLRRFKVVSTGRLLWEKVPLCALSLASVTVTFIVQQAGGAVKTLEAVPLRPRLSNAVVSYANYLVDTLFPRGLAVIYPFPHEGLASARVVVAFVALGAITLLSLKFRERHPYFVVGWLWYLVALVPVIGLVPIGDQARADRYMYIPLIGIFFAVVWLLYDALKKSQRRSFFVFVPVALVLLAYSVVASLQVWHWRNSTDLFRRALEVTERNYVAHNNLGVALLSVDAAEAEFHFARAVELNEDYTDARINLGNSLFESGRNEEAIAQLLVAAELNPRHPFVYDNLGLALLSAGRVEEAREAFVQAARRNPQDASVREHLALAYARESENEKALEQYVNASALAPERLELRCRIVEVLLALERFEDALAESREVLSIEPSHLEALILAGRSAAHVGDIEAARGFYAAYLGLEPTNANVQAALEALQ